MYNDKEWFIEKSFKGQILQGYKIKSLLHEEQSKFQNIKVYETGPIGKLLTLDNKTMVSDLDEFVYHEIMAHVSTMVAPKSEKVLIIGGGDCGIVREFVKHPHIQQIDLVEIDERVIEVSKEYFPDCTSGLSDSRVNVLPQDGVEFIKNSKNTYDIIIIDSTDPEGFAQGLFSAEFYQHVYETLTDTGIMMNQTENPFLDEYGIGGIYKNLKTVFPVVSSLCAPMIIYPGVFWTFGFSSKGVSPIEFNPQRVEHMKKIQKSLKWYNMNWHVGAFAHSNFEKKVLGHDE